MKQDLDRAKTLLVQEGHTCVLCQGDAMYYSDERGVNPLLTFLESEHSFIGFSAADKVVGKATAFLYVLLQVSALHACVISEGALEVLVAHHLPVTYDTLVPHIINRTHDGICPFEATVQNTSDPSAALTLIYQTRTSLSQK